MKRNSKPGRLVKAMLVTAKDMKQAGITELRPEYKRSDFPGGPERAKYAER